MCKRCKPSGARRMDKCMKKLCKLLDSHPSITVLGSCCGHGKYPPSIIVKSREQYDSKIKFKIIDLITHIEIPRKRNFYKKDKKGYYYIPEIQNE